MRYRRAQNWSDTAKTKYEADPSTQWMWDGCWISVPFTSPGKTISLIGGHQGVDEAGIEYNVGPWGQRMEITAADDTGQTIFPATVSNDLCPVDAITIMLVYSKTDGTNRQSGGFGPISPTDSEHCGTHMPWSNGAIMWDFAGKNPNQRVQTPMYNAPYHNIEGVPEIFIFRAGPAGHSVHRAGSPDNPQLVDMGDSNTVAALTRTNANSTGWVFGGGNESYDADTGSWYAFVGWDYQMTDEQIARIAMDPFGMWVKKARVPLLTSAPPPAGGAEFPFRKYYMGGYAGV